MDNNNPQEKNRIDQALIDALRQNEEKYRTLVQNLSVGVYRNVLPDEGHFSQVNDAFVKMFGYDSADEIMRLKITDLYQDPNDRRSFIEVILKSGAVKNQELRLKKKDGTPIWCAISAKVQYDQRGNPLWIDGVLEDITDRKKMEDELREKETSLAEAQRIARMGNWEWNIRTNVIKWSDEIYRIFGLAPWDFNGTVEAFLSHVHPDDKDFVKQAIDDAVYKREPYSIDHSILLPNGQERIVHEQGEVEYDDKGKPVRMVGTINDITERKIMEGELRKHRDNLEELVKERTAEIVKVNESLQKEVSQRKAIEEALRVSGENYKNIFRHSPVALIQIDCSGMKECVDGLKARNVNDIKAYFESHPDELKTCVERIKAVDANNQALMLFDAAKNEELFATVQKSLISDTSSGFADMMIDSAGGLYSLEHEIIIHTASGTKKYCAVKVSTVSGSEETWSKALVSMVDMTERKLAEQALEISEANYRAIFDTANDGIFVFDIRTGVIIDVNRRGCEMYCYSREDVKGLSIDELSSGEKSYTKEDASEWIKKAAQGEPQVVEWLSKDKAGRIFWVEINLRRAIIGSRYCLLAIVRDITERKMSEEKVTELNKELVKSNTKLQQLAMKDSQTGLYGHRYLQDAVTKEFSRAKRGLTPLSVIMFDIDYFKSINDVYGHNFGDRVIQQFSNKLKKIVRLYDVVIRYGGEEFVVLSPDTNREGALRLAKRLIDKISLVRFGDRKHNVKIKLSAAVVSYPDDHVSKCSDLLNLADKVLNRAKEEGGNRICSALDIKRANGAIEKEVVKDVADVKLLKEKIEKLTRRGNQSLIEAIFAFAKTIEVKDHYTGEHVEKTVHYATEIAKEMRVAPADIECIKKAAALHDLGKVGISDKILRKKSKLSKKEFEEIKKHSQIGVDILRPVHFMHDIIPLILHHHERWDGKGYPDGLKGEEIPIGARIISVADAYDALTSKRSYRAAYTKKHALQIIKKASGSIYDPKVIAAFFRVVKEGK